MKHPASHLQLIVLTAIMAFSNFALAGSATWGTNPATGNWNTASNWNPATIPNGATNTATFGPSSKTAIGISANTQVSSVTFNSNASASTITIESNFTFTISGTGITNGAGAEEIFVAGTDVNHNPATILLTNSAFTYSASFTNNGGRTNFTNSSDAFTSTFTNKGSAIAGVAGGQTNFFDNATANNGQFFNEGGAVPLGGGAKITFSGNSNAGFAYFLNYGATAGGQAAGGVISFEGNATAANAIIRSYGGSANNATGAVTEFHDTSTAGNSALSAEGGSNGGKPGAIVFYDDSLGSNAELGLFDSELDISTHNASGITIGSIGGTGSVFLGANNLTIGSTNTDFDFDGILRDGGRNGGIGGSLTKTGTGRLRLTTENIYTGPTVVSGGKLFVTNSSGSATGNGLVTVTNNSVFGGSGRISGSVTVDSTGTVRGGLGTLAGDALFLSSNLSLVSGSTVEVSLGESGTHSTLARLGGSWNFSSNQAFNFIEVGAGAHSGLYNNIITGLSGDPGNTASWTIRNPFYVGSFAYDGAGNIDLNLTSVGGSIFCSEQADHRVLRFSTSGFFQSIPVSGLNQPAGLSVSEGKLFIVDFGNGTIGAYTVSGALINASLVSGLNGPGALAVSAGNIYVRNSNGTIGKYTTTGMEVNASLITGLTAPSSIGVSGNFLFVTDHDSGKIAKYTTSGALVNSSFIAGLHGPSGITISDGKLFVVNNPQGFNNGSVGKYDANTGATIDASLIAGLDFPIEVAASEGYLLILYEFGDVLAEYTTAGALVDSDLTGLSLSSAIAVVQDLLQVKTAVSRKTHGAAGTFDINLPLTGVPGVECRTGPVGGNYTLVFNFSNTVENGSASVTSGVGSLSGSPILQMTR